MGAEFRDSDLKVKHMISCLEDRVSGWAVRAERALLGVLEGGCAVPIGVWSTCDDVKSDSSFGSHSMRLTLLTVITSPDGAREVSEEVSAVITSPEDALRFGSQTALSLLEKGGRQIMDKLLADISQLS